MSESTLRTMLLVAVLGGVVACGGGDDGVTVKGQAILPPSAGGAPAANSAFQVVDLTQAAASQVVFQGTTDANGNYSAPVDAKGGIAVIVTGSRVRVSGLLNPKQQGRFKDFNGTTDIACEAGVTAVNQGSITGFDLTATRITNLESAAARLAPNVNFLSAAEVTAAAAQVRQMTNDGANPPP
jgi:hypothetical protein